MSYAPPAAIIFIETPGDRGVWKKSNPDYRRHKAPRPEHWPRRDTIPQLDREALKRRVEEFREATRPHVEALKAAGLDFRAAARERRTKQAHNQVL